MERIDYLYHYTSLESLALILKNRTIRLNPLDKLDDLQEKETSDIKNLGKFVFVSSWTEDSVESIPMWKMYSDPKSGVRIKMRKNPFLRHGTSASTVEKLMGQQVDSKRSDDMIDTFLDFSTMYNGGFYAVQGWKGDILKKIEYTNDINKLIPTAGYKDQKSININMGCLGTCKNTYWSYQHEWRYIMIFMPLNFKIGFESMEVYLAQLAHRLWEGKANPPFDYFDLDIASDCFKEMEITISPQMTAGNRVMLENVVEKYNPDAKLVESELFGKI